MTTILQRWERLNRQIKEGLRPLVADYKILAESFAGNLVVDAWIPPIDVIDVANLELRPLSPPVPSIWAQRTFPAWGRARRIWDAVESALSDIILLGTEQQVELAAQVVQELSAGKRVHTHELVVSPHTFIREALNLDPVLLKVVITIQNPTRTTATGGRDKGDKANGRPGGDGKGGMSMGRSPSSGPGSHHDDDDNADASDHHP
jgi:hypothetical protein